MSDGYGQYRNAMLLANRIVRKSPRTLGLVLTSLALLASVLAGSGPVSAEGATISLAPASLVLGVNGTGFIDVMVGDFASAGGLGAYILAISYDDSVVEVTGIVDGEAPFSGGTPTEVNPDGGGPFSKIDNDTGEVRFAAFQATQMIGPGGNFRIARINLQAVGAAGANSPIIIDAVALIDAQSGESVAVTLTNGSVLIDDNLGDVSGITTLQFRAATGGRALVGIACSGGFSANTVPADDGTWLITGVPSEICTLTATAPGYLKAEGALTVGSPPVAVPANELLAGDATGDGFVALNDITGMVAQFAQPTVNCEINGNVYDVNCDGVVALNDITRTITNFAKTTQPFPTS